MSELILVAPPRSGATLLAHLVRTDPRWGASTLSTHQLEDFRPDLGAPGRGFDSHRLDVTDATPSVVDLIVGAARKADPSDAASTVDWNPRLSLRVSLLAQALPAAQFLLLARHPVPTISSLMDAWQCRRFTSLPDLPHWWGEPWAFPLVEGWQDLIGAPPAVVCASQWARITSILLDDLEVLDPERWTVASFESLLDNPHAEVTQALNGLGLAWRGDVPDTLPVSSTSVSEPAAGKWQRNWSELSEALPTIQPVIDRLTAVLERKRAEWEWVEPQAPQVVAPQSRKLDSAGTPFASSHTTSLATLLEQAHASLLVSTYKSGHVIVVRHDEGKVDTEFTSMRRPMGVAVLGPRLAIGTADAILTFTANSQIAARVDSPREVDQAYLPRSIVFTGDIAIHDMAYDKTGALHFINTRFSCLCRQDLDHSFIPVWRPSWISGLAAQDRCHLNGLAIVKGTPTYVTALAQTNEPHGWRSQRGTSGVIVDITTDRVVAEGLSMPHSPRWHDGRLWALESGKGTLITLDVATGAVTTVATLPGFTRGLAFIGPYALVGLSQVRETVFTSLPITDQAAQRNCGVWAVDVRDGTIAAFLRFEGVVQEIFDVSVLTARWPKLVDQGDMTLSSFVLPPEAIAQIETSTSHTDNSGLPGPASSGSTSNHG